MVRWRPIAHAVSYVRSQGSVNGVFHSNFPFRPLQMSWLYETQPIAFDANFESGNLASTERTSDFEYDLFIQPDLSTTTRLWFYFRCQNVPLGRPVLFNIVGINKTSTTFAQRQRVLVRSTSRTKWQRLRDAQQFYTNSQKHQCYTPYPVLSFAFQFDVQEEYFFSFGYPYTFAMLQRFLTRIQENRLAFARIGQLGASFQSRALSLVRIGGAGEGEAAQTRYRDGTAVV